MGTAELKINLILCEERLANDNRKRATQSKLMQTTTSNPASALLMRWNSYLYIKHSSHTILIQSKLRTLIHIPKLLVGSDRFGQSEPTCVLIVRGNVILLATAGSNQWVIFGRSKSVCSNH